MQITVTKFIAGIVAIVVALVGVIMLFTATSINTEPDQEGLWYKAGPLTSTSFDHCVKPGTRELFGGIADKTYAYPAGVRTYEFHGGGTQDAAPVKALTKDNLELTVSGVVRFQLNTDCKVLQQFHEQIGLKTNSYMDGDKTSEGWTAMLATFLQQSLQRAVNEATQDFNWKDLYSSTAVKTDWEKKVAELLPTYVKQGMGGEYFNNYSLTIQKPELPADLLKALQDTQTAIEQTNAQKQRNTQVETEIQSIAKLVAILGPDGYNTYQAIKDGKISVMPLPQGSSFVVNPPAATK